MRRESQSNVKTKKKNEKRKHKKSTNSIQRREKVQQNVERAKRYTKKIMPMVALYMALCGDSVDGEKEL